MAYLGKRKSHIILIISVLSIISVYSLATFANQESIYFNFPNDGNSEAENLNLSLALTAPLENSVSMTYTPSTYEIRTNSQSEFVDLQIYDAILGSNNDVEFTTGHEMDLIFNYDNSEVGKWAVKCIIDSEPQEILDSESVSKRIKIKNNQCNFNTAWSGTLRIYPGESKSLKMKIVWDNDAEGDGDPENLYGINGLGLINVYRFRTKASTGTIGIAKTDTSKIIANSINPIGENFKTYKNKADYESSLNWTTLYNLGIGAKFSFTIDVADKNQVILFDKDADADELFLDEFGENAVPPDDSIQLSVLWEDNSPVSDWTELDQRTFNELENPKPIGVSGEYNSYTGPSGDTLADENGEYSIKWYKIDVSEKKSDKIKVIWENFGVANNGIAFASDTTVEGTEVEDEPDPLDYCLPDDELCLEDFEKCEGDPECLEELKDCDLPSADCPLPDPTIPKCRESGALRACISSTPFPDPHPDSFVEKGDVITYHVTLENISTPEQPVQLENLNIGFNPPVSTSLDPSLIASFIPAEGSGTYTGKGPGRFEVAATLSPGSLLNKDIKVTVDTDTLLEDYDITTAERVTAAAENNPSIVLESLIHHVGEGAVNIVVTRCFAFDYYGGEFQCNTTCSTIEPGTKVTVRDFLFNTGGQSAINHTYEPPPLSSSFEYLANSVRIDHPISGISVSNDGQLFPPSITIPGPIEANGSREVFFSYYVPENLLDTDPPNEEEERDGKCYPKQNELEDVSEGYTPVEYETDCGSEETPEDSKNGLICVKVEENPRLEIELSAIPSPDNPVYQNSIITYVVRITNTTKQPVKNLIIEGFVPGMTTCSSGNCNGLNLMNPPELIGKGSFEYTFSVKVNETASGSNIVHSGQHIIYKGENEQIFEAVSNSLTHRLMTVPVPTGNFWHDIRLTRHIVLNTNDESKQRNAEKEDDNGDQSEVIHEFGYSGMKKQDPSKQHVYPYLSNGERMNSGSHTVSCNQISPYYYGGTKTYEAPASAWFTIYKQYPSPSTLYDSYVSLKEPLAILTLQVSTDVPQGRPKFKNLSGRGSDEQDVFTVTIRAASNINDGVKNGIDALNYFMLHGGESKNGPLKNGSILLTQDQTPNTLISAVKDGQADANAGKIETENSFTVVEEIWSFAYQGKLDTLSCWIEGCDNCGSFPIPISTYKWQRVSQRTLKLEASDRDYITALTSVAWLQTKNGNLGFGEAFWNSVPGNGDPNFVQLSDRTISTEMKFYTPPGEYNADFIIYSPENSDPLLSRIGEKIVSLGFDQGFIGPNETRKLSRGESYDRTEYPRDYMDDLLNKQIYGKVVRLNADRPTGFSLSGSTLVFTGPFSFESDTVYHYKGDAIIGSSGGSSPLVISGGRARLVVDGNVRIASNINYSKNSGDLSQIPSLRLHATGNILIDPSVTDIELMMLAENEFHSGKSDQQLRILGDVIAYKTFWERFPLNEARNADDALNKPSEVIYEDFRKYLLTPPGDKKLPDTGHFWREVGAGSGK
jgi:hypothetical protein